MPSSTFRMLCGVILLAGPFLAGGAGASDGRIEINEPRVEAGGVTPGDAPGYPVTIDESGSYVLTGDLSPPANTPGIDVTASDVSLDLAGFSLRSSFVCSSGSCLVGPGTPIGIFGHAERLTVTDGTVSGFASECIANTGVARVQGVRVRHCALNGINVGGGSLVLENRVEAVGFNGIQFLQSKLGVVRGNDVSNVGIRVSPSREIVAGVATGGNRCDAGGCSSRGRRRYYLTSQAPLATSAPAACNNGFHMASAFELLDPSGLEYASILGATEADTGTGPVSSLEGRVRTGQASSTTSNCSAWTSSSAAHTGAHLVLQSPASWNASGTQHAPWRAETARPCSGLARVWCVED